MSVLHKLSNIRQGMKIRIMMLILASALFSFCAAATEPLVRGDGMIPFVAVSGNPSESDVREKVASIQAHGMDSFRVYARSGLELE